MSKLGRPKSDITKNHIVTIRMTEEEYKRLKEFSQEHQRNITETIKEGVKLLYKTRH